MAELDLEVLRSFSERMAASYEAAQQYAYCPSSEPYRRLMRQAREAKRGLDACYDAAGVMAGAIDGDQPLPDLILRLHRDGLGPDEIAAELARLGRDSEADAAGISIRAVIEEAGACGVSEGQGKTFCTDPPMDKTQEQGEKERI